MYQVTKAELQKLRRDHPDYVSRALIQHEHNGKVRRRGDWMLFESLLSGDHAHGTTLIFEHIHFEVI